MQVDATLSADYVCELYSSCANTAIASQATAMQSALGFLNYQAQTGAIGHGEYFYLSFGTRAGYCGSDLCFFEMRAFEWHFHYRFSFFRQFVGLKRIFAPEYPVRFVPVPRI